MKRKVMTVILLTFVFVVMSIGYVWSFARLHIILGSGDMMFHANRMEELYRNVQQGVLIPRISTYSFNQVGSGINFFYPWLFLYPFVILRLITHNPINAFYLGLVLETFITFCVSYYAMYRYSRSKKRAFIFSLLYTFANYRLYLVFNQNVLAESIAYTFVPLVLLGFYETFFRNRQSWPLLAIGMSLLLYSHMLTTALTALFLLITLIIFWRGITNKGLRMLAAFKAVGLSIMLTAFFLFPFIEQTLGNRLRASWTGLMFVQQPMQVIESSINNEPTTAVGFLLILVIFAGFIYLGKSPLVEKYSYFAGLVLTLLTTKLFPWDGFLHTPVANLQFPYRLNGLATVMLCIYLSFLIQKLIVKLNSNYHVASFASLFILMVITGSFVVTASHQIITQRSQIPMLNKRPTPKKYYPIENGASYNLSKENWHNMFYYYGHNGSFDYFPVAVKGNVNDNVVNHYGIVNGKKVSFTKRLASSPNQLRYSLAGITTGSVVKLPVLYYRNDQVKVGDSNFKKPWVTNVDTIQIRVPKSNKQVIIRYHNSMIDNVALFISLLAWFAVVLIYINHVIKKRRNYETVLKID